jgi:threonine synthase
MPDARKHELNLVLKLASGHVSEHLTAPTSVRPAGGAGYKLKCLRCSWRDQPSLRMRCPLCQGALESELDLCGATVRDCQDPLLAYLDLLPLDLADLPAAGVVVRTPCRPAPELGAALGVPNLWIKDEGAQPTGSTKDRLAAVVVATFKHFGVTEFASSSTGNTATALARAVRLDGTMRAHFFCGADFETMHDFEVDDVVILTVIDGSYAEASRVGQTFARENGLQWEGGYFNWARREGLKLAYLEAFDAMEATPDVVVQAISSGMGMAAAHKAAREYLQLGRVTHIPRMLMAQQDTCAPMATAWRAGRSEIGAQDVVARPSGLATALLLGDGSDSYPYLAEIATNTGGAIVATDQADLVRARADIWELGRLDACYSAAVAVAALRDEAAAGHISDELVLVNLTGRSR